MRIIKTTKFSKWASKNQISDNLLISAAKEIASDKFDANYGSGIIKKRIANKGRGKSSSTRTIVVFKKGKNCFFVFGFEKSDKDNISSNEEKALKIVAKSLLAYMDNDLNNLIKEGSLIEVLYE